MRRNVLVSSSWVVRNWKMVEPAIKTKQVGLSKYSMRRVIVEICRTECGYSENTLPIDIWAAIERRYNQVKNEGN